MQKQTFIAAYTNIYLGRKGRYNKNDSNYDKGHVGPARNARLPLSSHSAKLHRICYSQCLSAGDLFRQRDGIFGGE